MRPIDPGRDHGVVVVFGEDQAEYVPLPARVSDLPVTGTTRWQLTDEERLAVAAGGDLLLHQLTFGAALQPVRFGIAGILDRKEEEAGDLILEAEGTTTPDAQPMLDEQLW